MATGVTTDTLRELGSFHADNGCALSIYVDLDPSSTPTIPDVRTKLNAILDEAEKAAEGVAGTRDGRLAVRDDLARIRSFLNGEFDRDGARGLAIFASSADGLFRVLQLPSGAGDSVRIGPRLHIAPLAAAVDGDGALVAFVTRERGTLYRLEAGRLREVADESQEQPGQHDQGGWSQARYRRHIEHLVQQHLKSVGGVLDEQVRRRPPWIVVVGPEEMRGEFEGSLSHEARAAIVGWTTAEAHAGPNELAALVKPLLDEARARADADALARFEELRGRGERAAAGWKEVLEAASDARVGVLLLEDGASAPGWECPRDGRAYAEGGTCPLDGTPLESRDDAADLALQQTLAHGGRAVRLGAGALDAATDGIAAILRF